MAGTVKVVLISAGMRDLLNDPGIAADMRRRAERGAEAARGSAEVETGTYRDSITAWSATTDRAVGRFGSDVDYADIVEANTGNLARALDAAG